MMTCKNNDQITYVYMIGGGCIFDNVQNDTFVVNYYEEREWDRWNTEWWDEMKYKWNNNEFNKPVNCKYISKSSLSVGEWRCSHEEFRDTIPNLCTYVHGHFGRGKCELMEG